MSTKRNRIFWLGGATLALLLINSCTDLEEKVYDQVKPDEFGKNQQQLDALIGPLYGSLTQYGWRYSEIHPTTDELVVPTRGTDWSDNGRWKRLSLHQWTPQQEDYDFNGLWTWIYNTVASINQQLVNPNLTDEAIVAELRTLRAFFHYLALDNFGNVINSDNKSGENTHQSTPAEEYSFLEK